jgi:hypothetical protein
MKKSTLNKISKIALLFLAVTLIGSFCVQIVSANQSPVMVAKEFSHTKSASSDMMPCCEESNAHLLATFNLPPTKYPLSILIVLLLSAAIATGLAVVFLNIFHRNSYSYSFLAPPGPDLMLAVIKRE